MSSFIGHAAIGAAIYLGRTGAGRPAPRWALPLLVGLALSPDIDYLGLWWFGIVPQPRATHSLLFCLGGAAFAWLCLRRTSAQTRALLSLPALALAACSHLLLDLLVGVHSLPLLWPWAGGDVSSPIGLLPSAGRLSLRNFYFWRNLFIECAVLLPVLAMGVAMGRSVPLRSVWPKALLVLPAWIACLVWSLQLPR